MTYTFSYCAPNDAVTLWPKIAKYIEPALAVGGGRFSTADVLEWVKLGRYGVFVAADPAGEMVAVMVLCFQEYPQMRVLEVSYVGGRDFRRWRRELVRAVVTVARNTGCSKVEFRGRKEWGRILRQDEAVVTGVLYEVSISPCSPKSVPGPMAPSTSVH
jgi:hypothetical protein